MVLCINSHINGQIKSIEKPLLFRCNRRLSKDIKSPLTIYSKWRNGDEGVQRDFDKIKQELILDTKVINKSTFSIEEIFLRNYEQRKLSNQYGDPPIYLKIYQNLSIFARISPPPASYGYLFRPVDLVGVQVPTEFHRKHKSNIHEYWSNFGQHLLNYSRTTTRTVPPYLTNFRRKMESVLRDT